MRKKIGIIGLNGQAKKIIEIIDQTNGVELKKIFYHKINNDKKINRVTKNFNDLLSLDAIIIASPTHTHYGYLLRMKKFKGHILVEKPIASKRSEIKKILDYKDSRKRKIMINFNFNFSKIFFLIEKMIKNKKNGKPVKLFISTNHGLAFKKNNNWRFDFKKCRGVGEMVSCHFIKFATSLFGEIKSLQKFETNFSHNGKKKNFDTINLNFVTKKNILVNIFNSYATPYITYIKIFFTNSIVLYDGNHFTINYPREVFDKKNRFKFPPKVFNAKLNFGDVWSDSLDKSVKFFLKAVKQNKNFSISEFNSSVKSISPIIK